MSWIYKLCETYENCNSEVGKASPDGKTPLLPIAHSTQKAQVEVVIDDSGNFISANVLEESDSETIIPCTEDSASRGNGNFPHALFDKLQS